MVLKLSFSRFPHSDICGLLDICSSPQLFAAYHVLLRLPVPRHPPYALFCLTSFSQMYSVTFDFLTMILIHCFNELISSMNSFHCFFYFWSLFLSVWYDSCFVSFSVSSSFGLLPLFDFCLLLDFYPFDTFPLLISHLGCLNILMFLYLNMQFSWNNRTLSYCPFP